MGDYDLDLVIVVLWVMRLFFVVIRHVFSVGNIFVCGVGVGCVGGFYVCGVGTLCCIWSKIWIICDC